MKLLFMLDYEYFKTELLRVAERCADFCDMLWFRFKGDATPNILTAAELLRKTLPDKKILLSRLPDIASKLGFNGVHLNSASVSPQQARLRYPHLMIGFSAHSPEECRASGADYNTLSPIFNSKDGRPPLGLFSPPADNVFLLGGVNSANVKKVIELDYAGVAGISFYNEIEKIYQICKNLRKF
jgi:thiamine-phosphate pyrophosphorylase